MLRLINIEYKVPFAEVEQHLSAHREYLQKFYDAGNFIASGPKDPKTGGMILALGELDFLNGVIEQDPFYLNGVADFNIVSFDPVKKSSAFSVLLENMQACRRN